MRQNSVQYIYLIRHRGSSQKRVNIQSQTSNRTAGENHKLQNEATLGQRNESFHQTKQLDEKLDTEKRKTAQSFGEQKNDKVTIQPWLIFFENDTSRP